MKKRGGWTQFVGGDTRCAGAFSFLFISFLFVFVPLAHAELSADNLLVLVNANSATSQYIAKMYCGYYPSIQSKQVLELNGLADCSGPASTAADEIITREVYNTCIAEPVRQHLIDNNLLDEVMVIVTTAGMPYRIEDTNPAFANVIYPSGSAWQVVADNESMLDAASVESELTCLWYGDTGENPAGIRNRIINPYQACRSGFDLFERSVPDSTGLRWTYAISLEAGVDAPIMEGYRYGYGAKDRFFGPGHIYLTCRLDGPKNQGKSAVFAVRNMLERSKRASDPASGVNPYQAAVILDDAPFDAATGMNNIDYGRIYNLHSSVLYWEHTEGQNAPPDAYYVRPTDDYVGAYEQIVDLLFDYSKVLTSSDFLDAPDILVCLDYRSRASMCQSLLGETSSYYPARTPNQGAIAYASFGCNGDDGKSADYLYCGGDDGGAMFTLVNGAVFTSLESFNAVTLFSDQPTTQAKIIDYIDIGGSGAIGHSFEPQADAAIDNEFVFFNLLADKDGDLKADMCFVEAAFSGIPYLSWTEVVIGDPLMRIVYGPGEPEVWTPFSGDVNGDDKVNFVDVAKVRLSNGSALYTDDSDNNSKYNDLCDINADGKINFIDVAKVRLLNGTVR
ncbi:MAG: dockerin type I domain-containing protein [Planctomycetota bacterium]